MPMLRYDGGHMDNLTTGLSHVLAECCFHTVHLPLLYSLVAVCMAIMAAC